MRRGERNSQEDRQLRGRTRGISVRDSGQADSRCLTIEQPGVAPTESKQGLACAFTHPRHQPDFISQGMAIRAGIRRPRA